MLKAKSRFLAVALFQLFLKRFRNNKAEFLVLMEHSFGQINLVPEIIFPKLTARFLPNRPVHAPYPNTVWAWAPLLFVERLHVRHEFVTVIEKFHPVVPRIVGICFLKNDNPIAGSFDEILRFILEGINQLSVLASPRKNFCFRVGNTPIKVPEASNIKEGDETMNQPLFFFQTNLPVSAYFKAIKTTAIRSVQRNLVLMPSYFV